MVDDPRLRKAHVKRVYLSDPVDTSDQPFNPNAGPPSPDAGKPTDKSIWVDVLRIDNMFIDYKAIDTGKRTSTQYKFTWNDDPKKADPDNNTADVQQENGNSARKTKQVLVHNPQEYDPSNKTAGTSIPLWLINKTPVSNRGGGQPGIEDGQTHQVISWKFNNTNPVDAQD